MCAEEDAAGEEIDVADGETLVIAHGVEMRQRGCGAAIGSEGVVVAVEDGDDGGEQERLHADDVGSGEADSDEAFPLAARGGAARAQAAQGFGGKLKHALDAGGADVWLGEGDGVADERDLSDFADLLREQDASGTARGGQQVGDFQVLCAQELVQRGERELAAAMQEVGEMRLTDARLLCEQ